MHVLLLLLSILIFSPDLALADANSTEKFIEDLPSPRESRGVRQIVRRDFAKVKPLLPEQVYRWVEDGRIVLNVFKDLRNDWSGQPDEFLSQQTDPSVQSQRILWRVERADSAAKNIRYDLDIAWGNERKVSKNISSQYRRTYESQEEAVEDKKDGELELQVFREDVFASYAPSIVKGFYISSRRYLGGYEDDIWINSAVTRKNRKVLSTNRGDSVFGSPLTFDDLFVWSNNSQSVAVRLIEERKMLLPFSSANFSMARAMLEQEVEGKLVYQPTGSSAFKETEKGRRVWSVVLSERLDDGQSASVRWNYESGVAYEAATWHPVSSIFIPRDVYVLETSPKDPFYPNGREVLVVDKQTFLPVYKIVYDREGVLKKTVIGAWNLAFAQDNSGFFPYLSFLIVLDSSGSNPAVMLRSNSVIIDRS